VSLELWVPGRPSFHELRPKEGLFELHSTSTTIQINNL
jgi:hypothetical protein